MYLLGRCKQNSLLTRSLGIYSKIGFGFIKFLLLKPVKAFRKTPGANTVKGLTYIPGFLIGPLTEKERAIIPSPIISPRTGILPKIEFIK